MGGNLSEREKDDEEAFEQEGSQDRRLEFFLRGLNKSDLEGIHDSSPNDASSKLRSRWVEN